LLEKFFIMQHKNLFFNVALTTGIQEKKKVAQVR